MRGHKIKHCRPLLLQNLCLPQQTFSASLLQGKGDTHWLEILTCTCTLYVPPHPSLFTTHLSILTPHHPPLTLSPPTHHHTSLTPHPSPSTHHHPSLNPHLSLLTPHPLTTHPSPSTPPPPLTTHPSPLTLHHPPLTPLLVDIS